MTATVIYGTDFQRANPKADRAFWIGAETLELMAVEMHKEIERLIEDTSPCEMAPDGDCG